MEAVIEKIPPAVNTDVSAVASLTDSASNDHALRPQDSRPVLMQDGGLRGWSIVLADWIIQFFMAGAITSFGVFQSYYTTTYLTRYSATSISWVGTVQGFLELGLGFIGGRLFVVLSVYASTHWLNAQSRLDGGHFHTTVAVGSILFLFSFFMLSLAHEDSYYQIFLAQAVGMGTGLGIAFLPTSGAVAHHFSKNRALAMGIATTGVSFGGFAWSTYFNHALSSSIGFAWSIRIGAFACLVALIVANGLFMLHPGPSKNMEIEDEKQNNKPEKAPSVLFILSDPCYLLAWAFSFVYCLGLYFPAIYIELFAQDHPGIPNGVANWTLSIINLCAVVGRIIPNWVADRIGIFPVYIFCLIATGILCFVMPACTSTASIIVFCIIYGFFSGSVVSLYFATFAELSPNPAELGVRMGLGSFACAVGVLIGTPIASALVGSNNQWYKGTTFAGAALMGGAGLLAYAYVLHRRGASKRTPVSDSATAVDIPR